VGNAETQSKGGLRMKDEGKYCYGLGDMGWEIENEELRRIRG
jgi:hypothetical protein